MAFNATTVKTRYTGAGNIAILKTDFTKICDDLVTLETFAATASSNAGKWSALHLAEVTATPATSIQLFHINTNSYASTVTTGKWKQLLLDDTTIPGTNISVRHLKTAGSSATISVSLSGSTGQVVFQHLTTIATDVGTPTALVACHGSSVASGTPAGNFLVCGCGRADGGGVSNKYAIGVLHNINGANLVFVTARVYQISET